MPPHAGKLDPQLEEALADEQLRLVWSHATVGTVVATAFAVFLAFHLQSSISALYVHTWVALKLLVAAPRIAQGQLYNHRHHVGGRRWRMATYILLGLDGFVWGVAGMVVAQEAIPTASLITACLACVACVATFGLQVRMLATAAYVAPMIVLTGVSLLFRGDEFGIFSGSALAFFLSLLLVTAFRSERRLADVFLLRLHASRIAADLEAALELAQRNAAERELALELAQRKSAVKSQFLATMSHELRTPLHGILGVAQLLHIEANDAAVRRRVDLIESSGEHLLGLINDLLDISRIESGHLNMQQIAFDLQQEVEKVAEVYSVRAEEKGLRFATRLLLERPCHVTGDPARLRQVLHNLLGNALKFTQVGHISLQVEHAAEGRFVCEIRDSGVGISDSDQARIFDAFKQADSALDRPFEGTGLGLTIAREIARAMGGDIVCKSALGVGSSFRFSAVLTPVRAEEDQTAVISIQEARRAHRAGVHVLLAEDDDVNALVASAFLEREGISVERVANGQDALRRVCKRYGRPDLVLMDVRMPIMDGPTSVRLIRAQESALSLPRIPIVGLTAELNDDDRAKYLAMGMDDCLGKPFGESDICRVLDAWVDRPRPFGATRAGGLASGGGGFPAS